MTNQADEALLRLLMAGGALAPRRALLQAAGRAETAIAQGAANWRARLHARAVRRTDRPTPGPWPWHGAGWKTTTSTCWPSPIRPSRLLDVPNPPALFIAGDPSRAWRPSVALVGSRSPTRADALAARFAGCFVDAGLAVTSGLAAGIDAAAHQALDAGAAPWR